MDNNKLIQKQIDKVEQNRKELLLNIELERFNKRRNKKKADLQLRDGILVGLKWALLNVRP